MKVAIAGCTGRMGRSLVEGVCGDAHLTLVAALERTGHPDIGIEVRSDAGVPTGVMIRDDHVAALAGADVLIDFTRPEGTLAHLKTSVAQKVALVIGTTGFSAAQRAEIQLAAQTIPIVLAPNMAVGVNAAIKLSEVAARILGNSFDVEIIEAHHRHKVDAPSGTALKLGEVVARALGRDLPAVALHGRHGETGERKASTIGFHAIRGGDIVGEHTVLFAGDGERLEITVRSSSRLTYVLGALRAVKFLREKSAGLYDMNDVLGLGSL